MTARQSVQSIGLGAALGISAFVHLLLLIWSPSVSPGGTQRTGRPPDSALRASLKLAAAERHDPAEQAGSPERPSVPPSAQVPRNNEAEPRRSHVQTNAPLKLLGYFPVTALSRMPEAISRFDIQPPAGGDTGQDGRMKIRVWIGAGGAVEHTQLLSSGLPDAYAKAALAAFGKLRFQPGEIAGEPVPSWADIVIEYADFGR